MLQTVSGNSVVLLLTTKKYYRVEYDFVKSIVGQVPNLHAFSLCAVLAALRALSLPHVGDALNLSLLTRVFIFRCVVRQVVVTPLLAVTDLKVISQPSPATDQGPSLALRVFYAENEPEPPAPDAEPEFEGESVRLRVCACVDALFFSYQGNRLCCRVLWSRCCPHSPRSTCFAGVSLQALTCRVVVAMVVMLYA